MAYDPTLPRDNSLVAAGELRNQFAGLKSLMDVRPTMAEVETAIAQRLAPVMDIAFLRLSVSDPPTQAEVQAVADKLDELLSAFRGQRARLKARERLKVKG